MRIHWIGRGVLYMSSTSKLAGLQSSAINFPDDGMLFVKSYKPLEPGEEELNLPNKAEEAPIAPNSP